MIFATPIRALIFDFDGVLADTEEVHCAAFQVVAASFGAACPRADYYDQFLGLPDRECLAALGLRAGLALDAAQLDALVARKRAEFAALSRAAGLYPGVADTLRRLNEHFILAIASGAFRDEIDAILERHQVRSLFAAVVGAEDVRAGKPAPDPFLEALRAIREVTGAAIEAAQCIVIEDAPRGIEAARAAGMRCIAVTTSHDRVALAAADAVIASVCELQPQCLTSAAVLGDCEPAKEIVDKREPQPSRRSQEKGPPQGKWKVAFEGNDGTARPEEPPCSDGASKPVPSSVEGAARWRKFSQPESESPASPPRSRRSS